MFRRQIILVEGDLFEGLLEFPALFITKFKEGPSNELLFG